MDRKRDDVKIVKAGKEMIWMTDYLEKLGSWKGDDMDDRLSRKIGQEVAREDSLYRMSYSW